MQKCNAHNFGLDLQRKTKTLRAL